MRRFYNRAEQSHTFNITIKSLQNYEIMKNLFLILFCLAICTLSCKDDDTVIDPCEGITCVNGECINGICDCITGFDGPSCNNQITPSSIRVVGIDVLRFPALNQQNGSWDIDGGADLFVRMLESNVSLYISSSITNANPTSTNSFNPTNLILNNPTNLYVVELWDSDALVNDFISGLSITPYSPQNGFPPSLSWGTIDGSIELRLNLEYIF